MKSQNDCVKLTCSSNCTEKDFKVILAEAVGSKVPHHREWRWSRDSNEDFSNGQDTIDVYDET